jgi:hypothetical protein
MMESVFLLGALAMTVFTLIVFRPLVGACLFLLANPLIVGFARGEIGIALRPNEVLLLFILAALGVRVLLLMLCGRYRMPKFDSMDAALLGLVATGSVMPVLWRAVRGLPLSTDDLLYAAVLVKYYALYRLFRGVVVDEAGAAACLRISFISAAIVAVVAILQVTGLFGVAHFLFVYYDQPFEGHADLLTARGTSTVASSFGLADLMIINLMAILALMRIRARGRLWLGAGALLFLSGCVVAGAFSGYIGLVVALLAFGVLTGTLHRLVPAGAVAAMIAAIAFWPVIENRLAGFTRRSGMPQSWEGRWSNLERFFFPPLFENDNWLLGVQPAPRLPASETWRQMIYIESGYVWLLWIGGIPFLLAFLWFSLTVLRKLGPVARSRADAVGCAAAAGYCSVIVIAVLMLFDPHLTVRGGADILYPMLALAMVPAQATSAASAPAEILPRPHASRRELPRFA